MRATAAAFYSHEVQAYWLVLERSRARNRRRSCEIPFPRRRSTWRQPRSRARRKFEEWGSQWSKLFLTNSISVFRRWSALWTRTVCFWKGDLRGSPRSGPGCGRRWLAWHGTAVVLPRHCPTGYRANRCEIRTRLTIVLTILLTIPPCRRSAADEARFIFCARVRDGGDGGAVARPECFANDLCRELPPRSAANHRRDFRRQAHS